MTTQEIASMIESVGVPYAYYQFEENNPNNPAPDPPFICFYYPTAEDFKADNINYAHINALTVELYTDAKDFDLEARVEAALTAAELPYAKGETYIDSERMYMTTYNTEVLITNG